MYSPQFSSGALLTDDQGKKYLVLSYHRAGHQYERYYVYTVLSDGVILEMDDFNPRLKKLILTDTMTNCSQ